MTDLCVSALIRAEEKGIVITSGTEMRHDYNFIKTHQAIAVEKALGRLYAGRVSFCIGHMFWSKSINPKTANDLVRTGQNWIALSGDHLLESSIWHKYICLGELVCA